MSSARNIFGGMVAAICLLCVLGSSGTIFAAGATDVIYDGSGGVIDLSPQELQAPFIPGNTAEEKIDRGTLTLINVILYVCGTIAGIMIIVGGMRYVLSAGSEMVEGAKKTILWAVLGLLMVFLAWAIVLNIVRIGSLEERVDYSENPIGGQCGPNVTMGCKGQCCGCGVFGENIFSCNSGLVCGGPKDVSGVRVCQAPEVPK